MFYLPAFHLLLLTHILLLPCSQTIQADGTYDTLSQLIFTASRFENGASFRCEADNVVMREDNDKPIHETLVLEVLCEYSGWNERTTDRVRW